MKAPITLIISLLSSVSSSKRIHFKKQMAPSSCVRCCGPLEKSAYPYGLSQTHGVAGDHHTYPLPEIKPKIDITILKGSKGEQGERGLSGKTGKEGPKGSVGVIGPKGNKGQPGIPGNSCKQYYAAFSVGRRKWMESEELQAQLIFDTEFVNLYQHFSMFTGRFYCYVPGIYFFNLNVHTWNFKETYLHLMHNSEEVVILYAQPSDRSIMQSQSVMLELWLKDEVWVRLYQNNRESAVYSDETDVYITFNGYLIKPAESE
ncbi:complement C1q tumor necrosis factor-related protein 1-like [Pristis pectinata]|uniref:complement C1q tumor necrosis factor-related protein 1-like n=1 Tax=Pristis pectinata TaxID=685728 RepID=UPI00223CE703|nr:complement C1q tumor necrosis factor-related protein 1-like [Pristis pectinata]XP_051877648.1 complement C1q tumor necrosis factor-related protein 1-like [Pristis pectinata]